VQPDAGTFPPLERSTRWRWHCRALPCAAWLDGMSRTASSATTNCSTLMVGQGRRCAQHRARPQLEYRLIPKQAALKQQQPVRGCCTWRRRWTLPLNVGTEMNSFGQPLVDNFDAPALAPVRARVSWMARPSSTVTRCWRVTLGIGLPERVGEIATAGARVRGTLFTRRRSRTAVPRPGARVRAADAAAAGR
jgi:hypothetical protein